MRRISHDLPGITQRIAKLSDNFESAVQDAQEVWRDDKGRIFFQQRTAEVTPTINQLVSTMSRTIEMFEDISKKVRDPDFE